jgi:hypothetical protein
MSTVKRALLSVTDKTGLIELARALARYGVELISTGGTAKSLREAGLAVTEVADYTGFPEMLDGRVKTLHPKVHGGILARRDVPAHAEAMSQHGTPPIDLVVVNLYPFGRTVAQSDVALEEAIENIDIGGPALVRSAGKNYRDEHRKWYLGDSISAGIGQGYNAFTPIQLAHAIAMIAGDGVGFTPHLVKTVQNVKTGEVREIAREPASRLNVKPEHLTIIRNALVGVNKEGTSAAAFRNAQYVSGGKTGTAQVFSLKGEKYSEHRVDERLRDHAWFVAYAPADRPRIALAVLVENGGFGAQAAAPIARKVLDRFLLGQTEPGAAQVVPGSDDEGD